MLDSKEELNEKKGSETMNKWREVQKLYDLSIKSVSSVKELLDTETPPEELDSTLTNDAYTALISLAGHFPSVAPFGAGKMKRSDFGEYKIKFANAIGQVKSDLQNVFNLIKTGEAGEESLQNARDGLRDFGDAIASIFGVPSSFKDAKVKPGDDKAPAVQEDPEAEKEPEEEKYSDEISEEDKKLLSAALKQDEKFYQRATKRLKELNLDRAEDMGFVPDVPISEIMKKTEDLIQDLESAKQRIQIGEKSLAKAGDSVTPKGKKRKELLKKSLQTYIKIYEKIQDSTRSGDMSSILDTNPVRVEKVQELIDISKRYLDEKTAINNLFVAVINDAFGEDPNLKEIWKALENADGKEAERLTGDMKSKIDTAGKNIKNTILNSFQPEKLDLSSFKEFVGMVADKVSKTAIQLDKKLNEEEKEEDIELQPTPGDIKKAEKEKADERDAPFKKKELKIYQENLDKAIQQMKSFVALYSAFDYAMDQIENEAGRTKFLEAFDKDFATVKAQLDIMKDHLKKVAQMFAAGTPSLTAAKEYGFPPKTSQAEPMPDDEEEKYNLKNLQSTAGLTDPELALYKKLLEALAEAKIIELKEETAPNVATKLFFEEVTEIMKSGNFSDEEQSILRKIIFKKKGVLDHLESVYKGDFEPGEFEVISNEDQETIKNTAKEELNKVNQKNPKASEKEKIKQAVKNTLSKTEIQAIADDGTDEEDVEEVIVQAISPDETEDSSEDEKAGKKEAGLTPQQLQEMSNLMDYLGDIDFEQRWIEVNNKQIQPKDAFVIYSTKAGEIKQEDFSGYYWPDAIGLDDPENRFMPGLKEKLKTRAPYVYVGIKTDEKTDEKTYVKGISFKNPQKLMPFMQAQFKKIEPPVSDLSSSMQEQLANKLKPLIKEMLNKGNKK
tara:strand:- start:638 stop:3328 length:2691 start_codon:yes stop_codon:yes gene_type:complete